MANSPVSVFGLGAMGTALATQFLRKGHKTTVWNRTPAKAQPLIAIGASHAPTIDSAAAASSLLIICQLDKASVMQTLQQAPTAWAAKTIVDLTNGTPAHARETADWALAHGARYIHGGIMAVPFMIGQPDAMILYSGPAAVFEGVKDTLSVLGTNTYVGEDVGLASLHDLALLSGMYGLFSGFTHAVALVQSANIPAAGFVATQLIPWLTAMTQHLNLLATQVDEKDYGDGGSSLDMQAKAAPNILEASQAQGVSVELIQPIFKLIERRVEEGKGSEGLAALVGMIMKGGTKDSV
ncbi:oxidoreductase [Blastomyces gilchristii SLH14081]|uniref:Oxidoreductase n=1 Tax=Blastomyces gilchristii (strain SLH14081) TaxID=559298 RepID=A0A179UH34_BLAGS|nr:oxidoreductase [Blastomyces gilchristii SLH14081]OAT07356.1 oxidoreductase [Blastomyces gilchristii SLH14081]